jgi:hypothetical protein
MAIVVEPGDRVNAEGYGFIMPTKAYFLIGPGAAFMMRSYWVVVTDRRFAMVRFPTVSGDVKIERMVPRSSVTVVQNQKWLGSRRVTVALEGKKIRLRFSALPQDDGAAISEALGTDATGKDYPDRPD